MPSLVEMGMRSSRNSFAMAYTSVFFFFFFFFFFFLIFHSRASKPLDDLAIAKADYQVLQDLKNALADPRGILSSWNGTGRATCSGAWVGIKCLRGRVIAIHLPGKQLAGRVSEKIGELTALRKLSLHDNSIGGRIPPALGLLPKLRGLYLFNNRFAGRIPQSIGRSGTLVNLDLSNNFLIGRIPSSLSNSTGLHRLNLSYNKLSGAIPDGLTRSPLLTYLFLQHNVLSGLIPDTWGGTEDAEIYRLQFLNLNSNAFSGSIPASFSKLRMLKEVSLSNNRLSGSIPNELGILPMIRRLDLSGNLIGGSFPVSLCDMSSLIQLNLESNQIDNQIPEAIDGLKDLSFLSLKSNRFHGELPATLGNISGLSLLDLSENNFTGEIPRSFEHLTKLSFFNVSNNNLSGPVPLALSQKFNASSFNGNIQLCGYISSVPCPSPSMNPSLPQRRSRLRLSTRDIVLIASGAAIALLLLLCCLLLCCCLNRNRTRLSRTSMAAKAGAGTEGESAEEAGGKLVHFDGPLVFTAGDLLCATAEIMGKGAFGTLYKATLEDGSEVAVKRLREKIVKNQAEFEAEVNVLGKIRHPNLVALRAYYLGPKGEKLLVFDYMPMGSLAAFLPATRSSDHRIDWKTRMNIAIGAARGLCYLHTELNMVHGHLTSTNVLLDENMGAKISDYGLSNLIIATASADIVRIKKADPKSDVYSLGLIILELLTGKSSMETVNGLDLLQWLAYMMNEERTEEAFDMELSRDMVGGIGNELLDTLKLALQCVDPSPEARPEVQQVLRQLEGIKPELTSRVRSSSVEEEGDGGAGASTSSG